MHLGCSTSGVSLRSVLSKYLESDILSKWELILPETSGSRHFISLLIQSAAAKVTGELRADLKQQLSRFNGDSGASL